MLYRKHCADIEALASRDSELLATIEDLIGRVITWPWRFTDAMLSTHLRFAERWKLTAFLLANRLPPTIIAKWYLQRGMLKDKAARNEIINIIRQHKDGTLERKGYTTWVMDAVATKSVLHKKSVYDGVGDPIGVSWDTDQIWKHNHVIETPSFAFDWQFNSQWDEAVLLLTRA